MQISKIQLHKSKTVGVMNQYGKANFKKVQIMAQADLTDKDDIDEAYKTLSNYIENKFEYEKSIK